MINSKYKNAYYDVRKIRDLKDLLESTVDIYGDKAAFLKKNKPGGIYNEVSYKEYKDDIDGLGTALIELALKDKKIAVLGENRYMWTVAYFAVAAGTGVVVPLDRELNENDIRDLLVRSGTSAVIYSAKYEQLIEEAAQGLDFIEYLIGMDLMENDLEAEIEKLSLEKLMDRGKALLEAGNVSFTKAKVDPDEMSTLIYTSGTTGKSKGVMLSHKNLVSNVYNMSKYVNVHDMVSLSVLPMHHTYEMTCHIMTAFYQGCTIAICEGLKYIVKNLSESKASVMVSVPLILENMHKKVWKNAEAKGKAGKMRKALALSKILGGQNRKNTKRLFKDIHNALGGNIKLFIAGGAAMNPKIIEDFNAFGLPMIQGYGMTENSPIIAVNRDRFSKPASVGTPMPETEVKIVDPDDSGIGEIICKGPSVMLGYFDDPEETAKTIIDGWLHTGDYGYFDEEGFLYVTGRKKNMIVRKNGKNISPEEVEIHLMDSDYIKEVVVWGKEEGDVAICADIFPDYEYLKENHGQLQADEIKAILKKEVNRLNEGLAIFKRVKRIHIRENEFEKTTSMKIKRHTVVR